MYPQRSGEGLGSHGEQAQPYLSLSEEGETELRGDDGARSCRLRASKGWVKVHIHTMWGLFLSSAKEG